MKKSKYSVNICEYRVFIRTLTTVNEYFDVFIKSLKATKRKSNKFRFRRTVCGIFEETSKELGFARLCLSSGKQSKSDCGAVMDWFRTKSAIDYSKLSHGRSAGFPRTLDTSTVRCRHR